MKQERTDFGESIRRIRIARNMSKKELSEEAGISESHLKKIESGARRPGISTYQKILEALDVDLIMWDRGDTIRDSCIALTQDMVLHCSDEQACNLLELLKTIKRLMLR